MRTDLLKHRVVRSVLKSRWYPGLFQLITTSVFTIVIIQLLFGPPNAFQNLGTALTWVIWWPFIPLFLVLSGRFWCAICPFAFVSDLVQKWFGLRRPVPKFLKKYGIWIIDAMFILITWADHIWGIVSNPRGSSLLLLGISGGVIFCGIVWQRRTWCRYLCFMGGMSGNYARTAIVELRANPKICQGCKARAACYNGNEHGPACPMFEFPRQMESNARCNLCAACIKTCPNDALQLSLRPPTRELWFIRNPRFEEAFLAVVLMGIVFVQNITMLEPWQQILTGLEHLTGTTNYYLNFTLAFTLAMALPCSLLGLAAFFAGRVNGDSVIRNFTRFGYALIPLDLAGHLAHNLYHFLAEGKTVVYSALTLVDNRVHIGPSNLVSNGVIQILQYVLLELGLMGSLYTAYRIAKKQYPRARVWPTFWPYAILLVVFGLINCWLFALPMYHRMM
ncbi:MAG TPA: 4Fe-4S binding protein [Chloroflexia bacterium]|nr:4Fe-4S binding protein [Chloroflexia bacterium]